MKSATTQCCELPPLPKRLEFDFALLDDCLGVYTRQSLESDELSTFASRLRFLSKLYEFLGGQRFSETLTKRLGEEFSKWAIQRWLADQHTPPPAICTRATTLALELIREIRNARQQGMSLHESSKNY